MEKIDRFIFHKQFNEEQHMVMINNSYNLYHFLKNIVIHLLFVC
jgi:hypothetical protein